MGERVVFPDGAGQEVVGTLWAAGRPSAVVVVHGIVGSRTMPEIEALALSLRDRLDVLAIDVRGHGDGPGRFTWGRDEWMQCEAAARFLGAPEREVSAIGFSFGGYHVAKAASRGAPFSRIVLVGAPSDLRVFDHFPLSRELWRHLPLMLRRRRKITRLERLPRLKERELKDEELSRIAVPALVVHGTDDWLITRRHAERFATTIPEASILDVEGGLHAEYLLQSSARELTGALRGFLSRS